MQGISPRQVFNNEQETGLGSTLIEHINKKLSDPKYASDWVRDGVKNPHFHITYPGTLSMGDKRKIYKTFKDAGWGHVEVTNSADGGECPGMSGVKLYKNPQ